MRIGWCSLLVAVSLPFLTAQIEPVVAQSAPCDSRLQADNSATGYRQRDNRCEGTFGRFLSAPVAVTFEVLSVTVGNISYDLSQQLVLFVSRRDSLKDDVHIRSLPRYPQMAYQMDARVKSGVSLRWPAQDVLYPAGMTASSIGVLAWPTNATGDTFVPIFVGKVEPPSAIGSQKQDIVIIFRPQAPVGNVKWRAAETSQEPCGGLAGDWQPIMRPAEPSPRPIAVQTQLARGSTACVEILGELLDRTPVQRRIRLAF